MLDSIYHDIKKFFENTFLAFGMKKLSFFPILICKQHCNGRQFITLPKSVFTSGL